MQRYKRHGSAMAPPSIDRQALRLAGHGGELSKLTRVAQHWLHKTGHLHHGKDRFADERDRTNGTYRAARATPPTHTSASGFCREVSSCGPCPASPMRARSASRARHVLSQRVHGKPTATARRVPLAWLEGSTIRSPSERLWCRTAGLQGRPGDIQARAARYRLIDFLTFAGNGCPGFLGVTYAVTPICGRVWRS